MKRLGTLVLAAATLMLETTLTRVFALSQGHHFAFITISIALLGMGAGGTALTLWPRIKLGFRGRGHVEDALALAAVGFAVTTLGGYLVLNAFPFDTYAIAWEPAQLLYLVVDYMALAAPFFCSGLAIGLVLETAQQGNIVYAANLVGSAGGCLIALGVLSWIGGAGAIAASSAAGWIAAAAFVGGRWDRRPGSPTAIALSCGLGVGISLGLAWMRPAWFEVRLSPYRPLSYTLQYPGARVLSSRWNAFARVDVVESDAIHVSPGLSLGFAGEVPGQRGLYVDAHAQAPLVDQSLDALEDWASALPLSIAYRLRPRADVLVLEPGGGLDVAVALSDGASRVTAVSSNPLVVDAVWRYGRGLYDGMEVRAVVRSPRSFVRALRSDGQERFTVVDVALNDAQRAVVSGGYALSEDYRYTVQGFASYLEVLEPDGLLVVQRWLQTPPSESVRAWGLAVAALQESGWPRPEDSLVAIRSWSTMLILVKKGVFQAPELAAVRQFCAEQQFDLVYLPGLQLEEANVHNVYPGAPYYHAFRELLSAGDDAGYHRQQVYDVRLTTDARPFFFHFFKWRQMPEIWQQLGHTWQPFGGGGYLVLLAMLGVATLAAGGAILLPIAFARRGPVEAVGLPRGAVLGYFGCLGIAYLAVEIPLIQRLVLFLDHPTIAFAVVISVLLVSSGVGSLLSRRLCVRWTIPLLVAYLLVLSASLAGIYDLFLGSPLLVRASLVAALLAPLGGLMGVPFPAALDLLHRNAPGLIPWAWGVNGCTSVIASIVTALIALDWGFDGVLALAAAAYLLAWGVWIVLRRDLEIRTPGEFIVQ